MESEALGRDRQTGCEIDVPYYLTRGGLDQLFRLWVKVDANAPRQLYRGFRHCVPLAPGPHDISIWYGDRSHRGAAAQRLELADGQIHRLTYQAPFTLFFEAQVFVAEGRLRESRAVSSFAAAAWAAPDQGRFQDATVMALRPAFLGGEPYPLADRQRQARQFRWFRQFQHEPGRNGILAATVLLSGLGSVAWIGRMFLVGGDSWLALPLVPLVWLAAGFAVTLTSREGVAFHGRKLGATLGLIALAFLSIGGLADGWGLPTAAERRAEAALQQAMGVNRAHDVLLQAQEEARDGELATAVVLLEEARDLAPKNLEVRMALAHGLSRIGRSEEAMLEVIASFDQHPGIAAQELARSPNLVRAITHFDAFRALRGLHPEIDRELVALGFGEEWEFEPEDRVL